MSINNQNRVAGPFTGGTGTVLPFTFKVFLGTDMVVTQTSPLGVNTVLTSGYSVALNADQNVSPGGNVTLSVDPGAGYKTTLTSAVPYLQQVVLTNLGAFLPSVINDALDRLTILTQQLLTTTALSLAFPTSDGTGLTATLPTATVRATKLLAFDASGNAIVSNLTLAAIEAGSTAAAASATLASQWATLITGTVDGSEYSSKAYAIGGTGVTNGAGAAKEWAIKINATVNGIGYSAREHAEGVFTPTGSAKSWAILATSPDGTANQSSKTYAGQSAASATAGQGYMTAAQTAANQAIAAANGMKYREVRASTTTTLPANTYNNGTAGVGATLTGNANGALAAQDGVTLAVGERLLVQNEAATANNGIYSVTQVGTGSTPYILTRTTDNNTWSQITGTVVVVDEGTSDGDKVFLCTSNQGGTVGTTAIVFVSWAATILDGTLTLSKLVTQTTDTIVANISGSTASPTAVAIAANTFLAKGSAGALAAKAISDLGLTLVGRATAALMRSDLGAAQAASQTCTISGYIPTVANADINLWLHIPFGATVTLFETIAVSGTCTATLFDGASSRQANAVSTSIASNVPGTGTLTSGNTVKITISANAACLGMSFMIVYTRPLAT
jgi:hypothetical protein